jgi:hypothetical protein
MINLFIIKIPGKFAFVILCYLRILGVANDEGLSANWRTTPQN